MEKWCSGVQMIHWFTKPNADQWTRLRSESESWPKDSLSQTPVYWISERSESQSWINDSLIQTLTLWMTAERICVITWRFTDSNQFPKWVRSYSSLQAKDFMTQKPICWVHEEGVVAITEWFADSNPVLLNETTANLEPDWKDSLV